MLRHHFGPRYVLALDNLKWDSAICANIHVRVDLHIVDDDLLLELSLCHTERTLADPAEVLRLTSSVFDIYNHTPTTEAIRQIEYCTAGTMHKCADCLPEWAVLSQNGGKTMLTTWQTLGKAMDPNDERMACR